MPPPTGGWSRSLELKLDNINILVPSLLIGSMESMFMIFFFSGRRRHTRCSRDWSSDVCSSDLDGRDFFSEEKRQARHQVVYPAAGVPAYRLINTCQEGRYRIEKEIVADPRRDVVLQRVRFVPLRDASQDYHLYVLLAPHIGNRGYGNTAWVGDYKGVPMLFAEREGNALALAGSAAWLKRSAGFVGVSEGWQDLMQHKQMTWTYARAENGNVALTGEIDWQAVDG